jgi:hypothetical protein
MDTEAVKNLTNLGIETIYGKDSVLYYTESNLNLSDLYEKDGVQYTAEKLM